jgi:predicted tellurium resistance membrane protein TerC
VAVVAVVTIAVLVAATVAVVAVVTIAVLVAATVAVVVVVAVVLVAIGNHLCLSRIVKTRTEER